MDRRDDPDLSAALAVLGRASEPVRDGVAALLTAVGLVLLGAPAGLLWGALAPRVQVVIGESGGVGLADPETTAFVGGDVVFGAVVLAAGLVCGLVALAPVARPHGPGVVVGLLLGGLLAAYVAAETGEQVGLAEFRAAVEEARRGTVEASLRLRAVEAIVFWPVGALAAFALGTWLRTEEPPVHGVSSG